MLEPLAEVLIVEEEDDGEKRGEDEGAGHQLVPDPGLATSLN